MAERARFEKAADARRFKRDLRCPKCEVALHRNGRRHDGVQAYVCPKCGAIIRATKLVNVVCGDCDVAFEIAK